MMYTVTKRFRFEASHRLELWPVGHPCQRMHGHSYVLEVSLKHRSLTVLTDPKPGVIADFGDISKHVEELIIKDWDHQVLNDVLKIPNTTAEILAHTAFDILTPVFGNMLYKIRLQETESGWAEIERE